MRYINASLARSRLCGLLAISVGVPAHFNRPTVVGRNYRFSSCVKQFIVTLVAVGTIFITNAPAQRMTSHLESFIEKEGPNVAGLDNGNPLFLPAMLYRSGGTEAGFVAAADVNSDGYPDLLAANSYVSNTIGVRLGKGDGTFWDVAKFGSGGGGPLSIVPVDLNGDGKLDLVVLNQGPCYACTGDSVVSILLGKGTGKFQTAVTYDAGGVGAGGIGPSQLAVADMNRDGKLDIIVSLCAPAGSSCGDGNGVVSVLLGNGDGTFRPALTHNSGSSSTQGGLAVGDVNGDGKPDVLITNQCASSGDCSRGAVGVLLGNGDGTVRRAVIYATAGWSANGIVAADVNGDGKLDVLVAGCGLSDCWVPNGTVTVLLGKGDGTFQAPIAYDSGGRDANGLAVADLNGDGELDVVVANTVDRSVGVLLGNGDGTFQSPLAFPTSSGTFDYSVAVSDLDGDGKLDVLVSNCGGKGTGCGGRDSGTVGVLLSYGPVTQTGLTTSESPSLVGQLVTFTAKVSSSSGPIPDGDAVAFYDWTRKRKLASVALSGGIAIYSTSSLPAGPHNIEALYLGDVSFKRSSAVVKQVVQKALD